MSVVYVAVSRLWYFPHLSKNKKRRFWDGEKNQEGVQRAYNQQDTGKENKGLKQTKKRLKCFLSFT